MPTDLRSAKPYAYYDAVKVLKGDCSYFDVSVRVGRLSQGYILLDSTAMHRILTGVVEHPRSLYGDDKALILTLALMSIADKENVPSTDIVSAGETFLATHVGRTSARLLFAAMDVPSWLDKKASSFSITLNFSLSHIVREAIKGEINKKPER